MMRTNDSSQTAEAFMIHMVEDARRMVDEAERSLEEHKRWIQAFRVHTEADECKAEILWRGFREMERMKREIEESLRELMMGNNHDKTKHSGVEKEDAEEDCCCICLEKMLPPWYWDVTCMPCRHRFHDRCISKWLEKKDSCPLCRAKILFRSF